MRENSVTAEVIEETPQAIVPITPQTLAPIQFDLEAAKAIVKDQLAIFKGLSVDITNKESVKDAKKIRAQINAWSKELKAAAMKAKAPYKAEMDRINAQVKELESLYLESVNEIDVYLEAYKDKTRSERFDTLNEYYVGFAGDLSEIVEFEDLLRANPSWLNESFNLKKAQREIELWVQRIIRERQTLKQVAGPHLTEADMNYCKFLNLELAVRLSKDLELKEKAQADHAKKAAELETLRAQNTGQTEDIPEADTHSHIKEIRVDLDRFGYSLDATNYEPVVISALCDTLTQKAVLVSTCEYAGCKWFERPPKK